MGIAFKRKSGDKNSKKDRDGSPIRMKRRRFSGQLDLDQLQIFIRRNPKLYRDDFLRQLEAFHANRDLFRLSPNVYLKQFDMLTSFVMRLAHFYPEDTKTLPSELFGLLKDFGKVMDPKLRNTFVQGLMHLRGKSVISQLELYPSFIKLASASDKGLRKLLQSFIINDVVKTARKSNDSKVKARLQTFFGNGVQDDNGHIAKLSLNVLTKLYTKNTWNDAKTVNLIAEACFAKNSTISVCAVKFFLGRDEAPQEDASDDSDDEKPTKKTGKRSEKQLLLAHRVGRKTHKRQKRLERSRRTLKKSKSKDKRDPLNFSAINLLYDPQAFADKLYQMLVKSHQKYEIRLNIMSLISRLVGTQQLILLNFYAFMQKYLQPRQRDVTKVLLFVAQASHSYVPPESLAIILRTIADNFVTDAHASEVVAVGLNAIREVIIRCPLALNEDLAGDLIGYRKHRDKVVQMAARALVQAIRDHNPTILRRKDRGRPTEEVIENEAEAVPTYGAPTASKDYIPGAEILFKEVGDDDDDDGDDESVKDGVETCSESEADEDSIESEPEDVSDVQSENEEASNVEKDVKVLLGISAEKRIEMARAISQTRILDAEDFERVKRLQLAKSTTAARKKKAETSEDESSEDENVDNPLPSLGDIQRGCGMKKDHDKAARVASIMKGREGREKYSGRGKPKMNPFASTTNRDKQRHKAFLMVRRKIVQEKNRRSFKAKQVRLHNSLLKMAKKGK